MGEVHHINLQKTIKKTLKSYDKDWGSPIVYDVGDIFQSEQVWFSYVVLPR